MPQYAPSTKEVLQTLLQGESPGNLLEALAEILQATGDEVSDAGETQNAQDNYTASGAIRVLGIGIDHILRNQNG